MDPSVQAQVVLGLGRSGLIGTLFVAGLLSWGLSAATEFTLPMGVLV
jgi:D-arabinose 5-phosphate isomerase GutQ